MAIETAFDKLKTYRDFNIFNRVYKETLRKEVRRLIIEKGHSEAAKLTGKTEKNLRNFFSQPTVYSVRWMLQVLGCLTGEKTPEDFKW